MRYATDIQLDQLIVHILNPWQPNGFVLSERTLPLDSNQRLVDYFAAHIQNSLQDPAAKAARFVALDGEAVSGICKVLLNGGLDMVEGSRLLAERLYRGACISWGGTARANRLSNRPLTHASRR